MACDVPIVRLRVETKNPRRELWSHRRSRELSNRVRLESTEGKKITGVKRHVCVDTIGLM
jgi:hypothetical protein